MIKFIKSSGEIAIATLITIGIAIGGSYLFTFQRSEAINLNLQEHIQKQSEDMQIIKTDNTVIKMKLDMLLKAQGITGQVKGVSTYAE